MSYKTKKIMKRLLAVILHLVIATAIVWLSYVAAEILDDVWSKWSMESYVGPLIAGPALIIYWLRKATRKLEA